MGNILLGCFEVDWVLIRSFVIMKVYLNVIYPIALAPPKKTTPYTVHDYTYNAFN